MTFYAHSENNFKESHLLSNHSKETATIAKSFACNEIYKAIFYLTGLLHDLGKYRCRSKTT